MTDRQRRIAAFRAALPVGQVVGSLHLAYRLNISQRTVFRYIKELRAEGMRILSDRGHGGGYLVK